jgi:hypothetical protein
VPALFVIRSSEWLGHHVRLILKSSDHFHLDSEQRSVLSLNSGPQVVLGSSEYGLDYIAEA